MVESGWWAPRLGGLEADTELYGTGGYGRIWAPVEPPAGYDHCALPMYAAQMDDFLRRVAPGDPSRRRAARRRRDRPDGARDRRARVRVGQEHGLKLVLGIDAGGTTTDAIVCTAEGPWSASARPGRATGRRSASRRPSLRSWPRPSAAGTEPRKLHSAGLALAGVDFPGDAELLDPALKSVGMPRRRLIVNDAFAALRAGSPTGVGVVSCAGTGCVSAGRAADGRTFRTLAIGYGEAGGSYELAREAVHAMARFYHGTGPATTLTDLLPQALGMRDANALFRAISRDDYVPAPSLARTVLDAAIDGDEVAQEHRRHDRDRACLRRLRGGRAAVDGGAVHRRAVGWRAPRRLPVARRRVQAEIAARLPRCPIHMLRALPAAGAALLALDELGRVDVGVHERLLQAAAR